MHILPEPVQSHDERDHQTPLLEGAPEKTNIAQLQASTAQLLMRTLREQIFICRRHSETQAGPQLLCIPPRPIFSSTPLNSP